MKDFRLSHVRLALAIGLFAPSALYAQSPPVQPPPAASPVSSEDTRLTVGVTSAIAGGSSRTTGLVMDLTLTAPLAGKALTRKNTPAVGAWFSARLGGQPQSASSSVKQFVGGFADTIGDGALDSVVYVADVVGGIELKLGNGTPYANNYKLQPLLFAGAGFTTTPPSGTPIPVFDLTPEARAAFVPDGDRGPYKYIGFAQPDRRSFDPQWYVGLRLRTQHFVCPISDKSTNCKDNEERVNFPGTIDVSFGRNASVSGNATDRLSQVIRLDAFYPLPVTGRASAIYFFGSALLHTKRIPEANSVVLKAATATVNVPSPDVFIHTFSSVERRRDAWQFGVAVDLINLLSKAAKPTGSAASTPPGK